MNSAIKNLLLRGAAALEDNSALSLEQKKSLSDELLAAAEEGGNKWWVVLLKVLAYAIGLILAGYGTTAATTLLLHTIL